MRSVVAHRNQSLLDIAIQEYGSVEAVVDIAMENDLSITDPLTPGQVILIPGDPIDSDIVTYYANRNIKPATAISELEQPMSIIFEPGIFAPEIF